MSARRFLSVNEINYSADAADAMLRRETNGQPKLPLHHLSDISDDNYEALWTLALLRTRQNRPEEALTVFARLPELPDVKIGHLHRLSHAAMQQNDPEKALSLLRVASRLTPGDIALRRDLIHAALMCGATGEALTEALALVQISDNASDWRLLAHVHASVNDWRSAKGAIDMAISRGLDTPMTRLDRAIILDESGDSDALRALESVAAETKHPDIAIRLARALYAHARKHDAKNMLDLAVRTWPDNVDLYVERARLQHWDGDPDEGASAIEAAVRARPYDMRLRLACADVLRRSGAAERALEVLREGLRFSPESAELLTSVGVVLDDEDRIGEALEALRAAAKAQPESFVARQNLASVLLRAGAPDEAHAILNALRLVRPLDQSTIGYEALALRMLGDPRYGELYDYTRLVRAYDIQAPAGFASADEFNQALAERLRALHISTRHPLNQSLRGGTQTDRSLPLSDPLIGAFFDFARQSVEAYAGNLDEASSHPVDARKAPAHRVAGSWSVRLAAGGFHINHVHPAGWLSSAYYVEVPPDVADDAAQAGWLKFGEPASATPGCTPDFAVQPKVGRLVLFPSYMWHGTVPFAAGAERLTIAFDVVPSPLTSPGR